MARASLALLFVLLVTAIATLWPIAPAAVGDPAPATPLRFGSTCADIVNRSDQLLRPTRRFDDVNGGVGSCVVF